MAPLSTCLEGNANLATSATLFSTLLAEARRALRLGGLSGDAPLTTPLPPQPDPVQTVPSHHEIVSALADAVSFTSISKAFPPPPTSPSEGIGLREILVTGRKPGNRPKAESHTAIHLGPFAEITDDLGHT